MNIQEIIEYIEAQTYLNRVEQRKIVKELKELSKDTEILDWIDSLKSTRIDFFSDGEKHLSSMDEFWYPTETEIKADNIRD